MLRYYVFCFLIILSGGGSAEHRDTVLPGDLMQALLAIPYSVDNKDLDRIKDWHSRLKNGLQNTVILTRPEYATDELSLLGSYQALSPSPISFENQCALRQVHYNWQSLYLGSLAEISRDLQMIIDALSTETYREILFKALGQVLSYLKHIETMLEGLNPNHPDKSAPVDVLYTWQLPKSALSVFSSRAFNHQLETISALELRYPGQNWDAERGGSLAEWEFVREGPLYHNGAIQLRVRDNLANLCLGASYLGLHLRIKVNYQYRRTDKWVDAANEVGVRLYAYGFDKQSFRLARARHQLRLYLRNRQVHFDQPQGAPYFFVRDHARLKAHQRRCAGESNELFFSDQLVCKLVVKDLRQYTALEKLYLSKHSHVVKHPLARRWSSSPALVALLIKVLN